MSTRLELIKWWMELIELTLFTCILPMWAADQILTWRKARRKRRKK